MNPDTEKSTPPNPRPRWLRWLLMAGLIALCALGFFYSNAAQFERFLNR